MMGQDPDHPFGKGSITADDRIKILSTLEAYVAENGGTLDYH